MAATPQSNDHVQTTEDGPKGHLKMFRWGYRMGRVASGIPGYYPAIIMLLAFGWLFDHESRRAIEYDASERAFSAWCPYWQSDPTWCRVGIRGLPKPSFN